MVGASSHTTYEAPIISGRTCRYYSLAQPHHPLALFAARRSCYQGRRRGVSECQCKSRERNPQKFRGATGRNGTAVGKPVARIGEQPWGMALLGAPSGACNGTFLGTGTASVLGPDPGPVGRHSPTISRTKDGLDGHLSAHGRRWRATGSGRQRAILGAETGDHFRGQGTFFDAGVCRIIAERQVRGRPSFRRSGLIATSCAWRRRFGLDWPLVVG